jgi:hypothetical protein
MMATPKKPLSAVKPVAAKATAAKPAAKVPAKVVAKSASPKAPMKAGAGKAGSAKVVAKPVGKLPAKPVVKVAVKPVAKIAAKPLPKKPAATEKLPAKPVMSKPAISKPVVAKPATKPVAPAAKPVAKPLPAKPASLARMFPLPRPTSLAAQFSGATLGSAKLPPRLQQLLDESDIQHVLATHCRALDRGEESVLRTLYHADATLDMGPGIFQGTIADYVAWVMSVMQQVKSSHTSISNIRLEIRGDEAFGETYVMAQNRLDKPTGREDLFLAGRYLDRFERRPSGAAGVWKIVHRKHVLDWVRTEPVADIFYHLNPDTLWGQRGKTDASYQLEQFPGGQGSGSKLPTFVGRRYEGKSIKL